MILLNDEIIKIIENNSQLETNLHPISLNINHIGNTRNLNC